MSYVPRMRYALAAVAVMAGCSATTPPAPSGLGPRASGLGQSTPQPQEMQKPEPPKPVEAKGSDVLLAVTGYSSEADKISHEDLAKGYCSGAIEVIGEVKAAADARFGCSGTATTVAEFVPHAKDATLLVDLDHATSQLKALAVDGKSFFAAPADYPLVLSAADFKPHLTHFVMTGVTAITRATGSACVAHGIDWLTQNLRSEMAGADYVHVSNEVSMAPGCEYVSKNTLSFCTKEADFQALVDLHVNVVELTGNHNRDYGDGAFKKTFEWYGKHGMQTFGAGLDPDGANKPIILPLADGKKLGIVGFNEKCPLHECAKGQGEVGANAYDEAKAIADLEDLKKQGADVIMVTVQFREWDFAKPTDSQKSIAKTLIDHGADLVYGSQAHEPQYLEFYKRKPIYYGIGNFLFDQIHRTAVRQGFFVHHYFWNGKLVQSVPVFTFMSDDRQPTIATFAQASAIKQTVFHDELLYKN